MTNPMPPTTFAAVSPKAAASPKTAGAQKAAHSAIFSCSREDLEDVARLISIIAKETLCDLLPRQPELTALGNRLRRVHPLKFLSIILSSPELKADLHKIHDDKIVFSLGDWSFFLPSIFESLSKWSYFKQDLSLALETKDLESKKNAETEKDSIAVNLQDFIEEANLDISPDSLQKLQDCVQKKNWEGFVLVLLKTPAKNPPAEALE
jgi:hypothetical protein